MTREDRRDAWPQALDYNVAIQAPGVCFRDPELRDAFVERHPVTRMPKLWTGGFADVYRLRRGSDLLAVKCFKRSASDVRDRYAAISARLAATRLPYFVEFRFLVDEMLVNGGRYPVVKMRWAEGTPLHDYVRERLASPRELRELAARLVAMVHDLEGAGLAHGDLQHGNILVGEASLTLVDYDGMYVPDFEGSAAPELGLPNYQHPRRSSAYYGPGVDRFPLVVLCAGLYALAADPELWERGNPVDTESVLFTKDDFLYPSESTLVACVRRLRDPAARAWLDRLLSACEGEAGTTDLPPVEDVDSGEDALVATGGSHRPVPWWVAVERASSTPDPLPVVQPPPAVWPAPRPPSFTEVPSGASLPLGRIAASALPFVALLGVFLALLVPGPAVFSVLTVAALLIAAVSSRGVLAVSTVAKLVVVGLFVLVLSRIVPVHMFIALTVVAGSLVADRYAKWKKGTSSHYGSLTAQFADVASTLQGLEAERGAVEREILALNRAELNEKSSSLLYLRRKADADGEPTPTALPSELERHITMRYHAARRSHATALANLHRSMADLKEEQNRIAAELDNLQPPTFLDFLSARPGARS